MLYVRNEVLQHFESTSRAWSIKLIQATNVRHVHKWAMKRFLTLTYVQSNIAYPWKMVVDTHVGMHNVDTEQQRRIMLIRSNFVNISPEKMRWRSIEVSWISIALKCFAVPSFANVVPACHKHHVETTALDTLSLKGAALTEVTRNYLAG